ncbi:MAG: trypsin-like peptidase domain-containing protein [Pyrinomonadaceae bacterium]|nr:trypsin-like peptidase domain-containing protein [Pyrinomonadaceae bacterium]
MPDGRKKSLPTIRGIFLSLVFSCLIFGLEMPISFAQTEPEKPSAAVTPEMLSASFAKISKRVEAAVVNIDTKGKIPDPVTLKGEKPATTNPDDVMEFFRQQMPRRPSYAVGSGFVVDKTGYILTNFHVIDDASRISVKLQSGEEFVARVVGTDEETDLAVLKIDAGRELPFIKLGNSDAAEVGDWVLAIGSPFGLDQTVTAGIISKTRRETPYASQFQKFIQTDAAINRGNSGGPLVDMNGEVIGINSQIATSTGDYNGIGFALPSNEAANVYRQIRLNGKVKRGYLGVILDSVKTEFAKVYGLPEAKGAIITEIRDKTSAAATAGLQTGDVILEFGGEKIANATDLIAKVAATAPEKEVSVVYLREVGNNLERKYALVKLAERPSNNAVVNEEPTPTKLTVSNVKKPIEPFGLTLMELTPALAAVYKLEGSKGLIIKNINPTSFIADVKNSNGADALSEGDLIQRINRVGVTDLKNFNDTASKLKKGDAVVLQVQTYDPRTRSLQFRIVQFTVQ